MKRYNVTVKSGVKRAESVSKTSNDSLLIITRSRPIGGEANESVISLLAKYFNTTKSNIKIKSGFKSKNKIIEVL